MMRFPQSALAALLACCAAATPLFAQTTVTAAAPAAAASAPPNSGMDAELFYQLLLGELNAQSNEPGAGFALILDAARKRKDPELYQRAVELALQARSGEAALQAARAWRQAFPQSREANRYTLQILVALDRIPETVDVIKSEIALAPAADRAAVISVLPRTLIRATDKKQAAGVAEQALADYLKSREYGAAAWSTVGRMRLAAGDTAGALEAARRGQAVNPTAEGPALLALELMDNKQPQAEAVVRKYFEGKPLPELRMAYARTLLDMQRFPEAQRQLQVLTRERPDYAEGWLAQGALLAQEHQLDAATTSLNKYLELASALPAGEERSRGMAQAYLGLSQVAEKRGDYAQANAWLDRIDNPQLLVSAQMRRASILARQGKLADARKLIQSLPERNPGDARMKATAEVQLLRDNKQYKAAYDLLGQLAAKDPEDADLLYDQAMLADKLNDFADMERLLRKIIAMKPDYHHAYNALGFSLADRNMRLPEAKQLIQKALEYAPGDPFISDSLGWVEFRMGHTAEALRILQAAYKERPDAEIAAHLGEVLWSTGQRQQAEAIWREGQMLNADNETLQQTLKRLKVKP